MRWFDTVEITMRSLSLVLFGAALACGFADAAEVTSSGFVIRHERIIEASPSRVYDSMTRQVGAWWDSRHTYSGDSNNLSIDARPGGCFCERLSSGGVEHMRVLYLKTDEMMRWGGGLGPLQGTGVSGSMTWRVSRAGDGSKLELTYVVGGFMPGGFESIAPAVERVLGEQADRLKRFVETGTPLEKK